MATNATAQRFAGKAVATAATNSQVQQAAGNAVCIEMRWCWGVGLGWVGCWLLGCRWLFGCWILTGY